MIQPISLQTPHSQSSTSSPNKHSHHKSTDHQNRKRFITLQPRARKYSDKEANNTMVSFTHKIKT
jgi:hypothetical protein